MWQITKSSEGAEKINPSKQEKSLKSPEATGQQDIQGHKYNTSHSQRNFSYV